jgi:hypothetical protein
LASALDLWLKPGQGQPSVDFSPSGSPQDECALWRSPSLALRVSGGAPTGQPIPALARDAWGAQPGSAHIARTLKGSPGRCEPLEGNRFAVHRALQTFHPGCARQASRAQGCIRLPLRGAVSQLSGISGPGSTGARSQGGRSLCRQYLRRWRTGDGKDSRPRVTHVMIRRHQLVVTHDRENRRHRVVLFVCDERSHICFRGSNQQSAG